MRICITALRPNVFCDLIHFRCINKCTLQPYQVRSVGKQHITTANQLISTTGIKNCSGVNLGCNPESNTSGEICLYCSCNDVYRRPLSCNDKMYPYRTC